MRINWKIRLQNKAFWVAAIPALLLVVQAVLGLLGIDWQPAALNDALLALLDAVVARLAVRGGETDPTTQGFQDSDRAMNYTCPGGKE